MPEGWEWDDTLFAGAAAFYERGRLPYPAGLADALADALDADAAPKPCRLLDVGCGPGTVARRVAHRFDEVVGVDPDREMLATAEALAAAAGITNAQWVLARAEELPVMGVGAFRAATFAQSFHWMDRLAVARAVLDLLEPEGAFVHVDVRHRPPVEAGSGAAHPAPPNDELLTLVRRYLGPQRRAGQGVLAHGTPSGEAAVLAEAGFGAPDLVAVPGGDHLSRTGDDVIAGHLSTSWSAPHLFGDRLDAFVADAGALLRAASPEGLFTERVPDVTLHVYRRTNHAQGAR
ncbi:MAG TPA: class I SAM-dependent methyltransferase [Acidimicrobiales bacterium]